MNDYQVCLLKECDGVLVRDDDASRSASISRRSLYLFRTGVIKDSFFRSENMNGWSGQDISKTIETAI